MSSDSTAPYYREQTKFHSTPETEEKSSSSSSTGDEPQSILGVLSSPSSAYLIHAFMGEGTFGKVAKCYKEATKEMVAVKVTKTSHMTAEAKNEVNALKKMRGFDADKYNFVRCNDAFIYRDHVCIEFEMLDMSLLDMMYKRPERSFTMKEIRAILHQVAITLTLLQSQGIVHTDLKPDNIMLVDHANHPLKVKVIDFGLVCQASPSGRYSYLQALCYRSPEIILGLPFSSAIDMWSLGCIAAELFLGDLLFPGTSEYNMLQHIIQAQGQLPQKLLKEGLKTKTFFNQKRARRKGCRRRWVLKTPNEYGQDAETEIDPKNMNDFLKIKPPCHLTDEDNKAELDDRDDFVELLKQMLHVDAHKRIKPTRLLQDPFITMDYLKNSHPNSFYFKSCCETMEVCQAQDPHVITEDDAPAWQSQWEHPLIVETASSFSKSLSFTENNGPPQQWHLSSSDIKEWIPSDSQLSTSKEVPHGTGMKSGSKRSKCSFETLLRSKKGLKRQIAETKRLMTEKDFVPRKADSSKEAESEASNSTEEDKPQRKSSPGTSSPERKRRRVMTPEGSKQASCETSTSEVNVKPQKKRARDAADALSENRSLERPIPENNRMEMNKDSAKSKTDSPKQAQSEASSSRVEDKPPRKRTRSAFSAAHPASNSPETSPPARKRSRMIMPEASLEISTPEVNIDPQKNRRRDAADAQSENRRLERPMPENNRLKADKDSANAETDSPKEAQSEASSSRVEDKPPRKRTRAAFTAAHPASNSPETSPPARKRRRMIMPEASLEISTPEVNINPQKKRRRDAADAQSENRSPDTSPPEERRRKIFPRYVTQQDGSEAASSDVTIKHLRKRTWEIFAVAQFGSSSNNGSPERKRRKIGLLDVSQQDQSPAAS